MICVYIKSHIAQQPLLNVFNGNVHDLNPPSSTIKLQIKIKKNKHEYFLSCDLFNSYVTFFFFNN